MFTTPWRWHRPLAVPTLALCPVYREDGNESPTAEPSSLANVNEPSALSHVLPPVERVLNV
jgi:hypothetical protein